MAEIHMARKEIQLASEYTEKAVKLQKLIGQARVKEIITKRDTVMKELIENDKTE